MIEPSERLLSEALKPPTAARARLAADLIASVDGEPDHDAKIARAAEVNRRVERVLAGGAQGEDWQVVHDRIEARLRSK